MNCKIIELLFIYYIFNLSWLNFCTNLIQVIILIYNVYNLLYGYETIIKYNTT